MAHTTPPRPFDVTAAFPQLAPWPARRPGSIPGPGRRQGRKARSAAHCCGLPPNHGLTATVRTFGTSTPRRQRPTTSGCNDAS